MYNAIRTILSCSILLQAASPAFADPAFIYRYKHPFATSSAPDTQEKDVVAYFIGGVGYEFSEILPLKPEWEDDTWSIVSGTLPDGITFDTQTRTFRGTPTSANPNTVVFLRGVDANGNQVAEARVSFDIRTIMGVPVEVDLYAHTGKYKVDELTIPNGVTVDHWERVNVGPLPPGITANGPYFEGVPTQAGQWRIYLVGMNYENQPVVTFYGKYTVDDRPTFPHIADNIQKLPQQEWGFGLPVGFGAPSTHKIRRAIDPSKAVKYYVEEKDPTTGLPGDVTVGGKPTALSVSGEIREPYDTATIRYKAVDSDGVEGHSNWFTFGSSDPQPSCNPYFNANLPLVFRTGKTNSVTIPSPYGDQGMPSYTVSEGSLPDGIQLMAANGVLSGVPTTAGQKTSFKVRIDVANGENTVSTTCAFNAEVRAASTSVVDRTPAQAKHVRIGDAYAGTVAVNGGIPAYSLGFEDPSAYPEIAFTSPVANAATVTLGGPIRTAGKQSFRLIMANGDGTTKSGAATAVGYGPLTIGDMQTVSVKRLAGAKTWGSVPYDASTVIPDVTTYADFPKFAVDAPQLLPTGISFTDSGNLTGSTSAAADRYGPFVATISDYSGDTDIGNPFYIVVEDRDAIVVSPPARTSFVVERQGTQDLPAPAIVQPPLAKTFKVTYTLVNASGADLPSWLTFDQDTGVFLASSNIAYSELGNYGPFRITATDSEGSTDTTDEFHLEVVDWPLPSASQKAIVRSTVSGNTSIDETATWVNITGLRDLIQDSTVIGGKANVVFGAADPAAPAGLAWDPANGEFTGRPTSEFNGNVNVSFKDTKGREGFITIPLKVQPYPTVRMEADEYMLPRLGEARLAPVPVKAIQGTGFWNAPEWSVDLIKGQPLPKGLRVDENTGAVVGQPTDPVDTVTSGIVLKAISAGANGEVLESRTAPFSIRITAPSDIALSYTPQFSTYYLNEVDRSLGLYTFNHQALAQPTLTGSHVKPLNYTLDAADAIAAGMTGNLSVNPTTGVFTGFPDRPGKWTVKVNVVDAEGRTIPSPVEVGVNATLDGDIKHSNGGGSYTLRVDEPFAAPALNITNYVGSTIFSVSPATIPASATLGFDPMTGEFTDLGYFEAPLNTYTVTLNARDAHDRTFGSDPARYLFTVKAPLELAATMNSSETLPRQYDPARQIDVSFSPSPKNGIGEISYGLGGDIPGTLVSRVYDKSGTSEYVWNFDNHHHVLSVDVLGVPTRYTVDGGPQGISKGVNPDGSQFALAASTYFPLDALVFDGRALTLKGTPSKSGSFAVTLTARDDHADAYIRNVPTRVPHNSATTTPFTLVVDAAADLVASNSANSETIALYGDQPSLAHRVSGAAYGRPVVWSAVSGTLPTGVSEVKQDHLLTYTGYPSATGTFGNIIWQARDAAGRRVTTDAATLTVGPEKPFTVSSSATTETVPQYTGQPAVSHTATGGSMGGTVTWTMISGTLPSNVTETIGATSVSYKGYPDVLGTSSNIVWRATDARGRTADTPPLAITVGPRLPLTLAADFMPPTYVVDAAVTQNTVKATNVADGKTVPSSDWTIIAADGVPTGMTAMIEDGRVVFSGTPTETGDWTVTVSATDTRGGSASLNLPFKVIPTDDEIGLTVADITTKVGYPYQMQAVSSNTYGKVRFYSEDISGDLASQLSLDGNSGLVSGIFNSIGNRDFDVYVTDDTNRVTSKPVVVNVIPALRITVPQIVEATQSVALDRTVATDYVLGTVTYVKGHGNWPVGVEVDNATGKLYSQYVNPADGSVTSEVVAASGNYSGLTIDAVDTFMIDGVTYTDRRTSNTFAIQVNPSELVPDIANPAKTILGTAGTPIKDWTPTVVDTSKKRPWILAGTTYTPSHDLTAYGLSFDTTTGRISGTATEGFIIQDFTVRVTSQRGDTDITTPFWIGVAPKDAMAINANQKTQYYFRINKAFATDPVVVDNTVGKLVFSKPSTSLNWNTSTGVWSYGASGHSSSWTNKNVEYKSTVTDEFGRTLAWSFWADFVNALNVSPLTVKYVGGVAFTSAAPTITGLTGSPSVSSSNLPSNATIDPATGVISGTLPTTGAGSYSATITVTDPDGTTANGTVTFTRENPDIVDIASNKLVFATEGSSGAFTPTVKQSDGSAWLYGGLSFSLSHDLTPYGLTFNTTSGQISGTPTAPVVIRDLVITVTTSTGASDSTTPFWFGIRPKTALAIQSGQKSAYRHRVFDTYRTDPLVVLNYVGNLTFASVTYTTQNFDTTTGQYWATPDMQTTGWYNNNANHTIRATDEFGRTVTFTQNQQWAIPLSAPNTELYASAGGTVSVAAPTVTGKRGNLTFTKISGPNYLAVGTTGAVSGTIPANPSLPQTVTIRITDDWDGRTADFSVTLKAPDAARYWRAQSQSGGASRFYEIVPLTSDGSSPIAISGLTAAADGNDTTYANSNGYIVYDFGKPVDVPAFTITTSVASGGTCTGAKTIPIQKSDNGSTWETVANYPYTIPTGCSNIKYKVTTTPY